MAIGVKNLENSSYIFEKQRLESFKNWPFKKNTSCNSEKMAEAGFYCIGGDEAACFVCGKELDGWEEEDNPWVEHKKHAPQCQFVKINKKEDNLTVKEFHLIVETFLKNQQEKIHKDKMMQFHRVTDTIRENIEKNFHPSTAL
ncbi:baculoviral IAP repeat-containing protein 5-like [Lutzomyia longipalpis]|uniref:baculoviral IAP repeat-containing protein 5-like n=1 Tax=Lutzomyia longipalpis TaxID=7200 RepID=UPI002484459C|nr:baculoviral IAP repeat-containing protein 5-like [Lutzomyia longipalpis]